MTDALTRYADRLGAESWRLAVELWDTKREIQDAKIERLEAKIEQLTKIQDQILATVMEQTKCIDHLTHRDEQLARAIGATFEAEEARG